MSDLLNGRLGRTDEIHDRRLDILQTLESIKDNECYKEFVAPIDVGGTDASHHSRDLAAMGGLGLVLIKRWPARNGRSVCAYRISREGEQYLKAI